MPEAVLKGRVALVTGVSRRQGIGFAIAQRLAMLGADVFMMQIDRGEQMLTVFQH